MKIYLFTPVLIAGLLLTGCGEPAPRPVDTITAISIDPDALTLGVGKSRNLKLLVEPEDATINATWSSSDNQIVKVNIAGTVTGVSEGSATVTVTCEKLTAECAVTVEETRDFNTLLTASGITLTCCTPVYDTDTPCKAVIAFPGGGYSNISGADEGADWTNFYFQQKIAFFVLSYRLPNGNPSLPIADAETAVSLIRKCAGELNIDKNDIGIMGSSAGGHLASTIATHSTGDAKPDFQILFYPVITMLEGTHQGSHDKFLGANPSLATETFYSNELQVTADTPKAFIVYAFDDQTVQYQPNGKAYYNALRSKGIPVTLKEYPSGGHGLRYYNGWTSAFQDDLISSLSEWLNES